MTNNKFNINPKQIYGDNIVNDTLKYQKQYKFDAGENNNTTWNNEADAFKHAYMQAQFALLGGKHLAKWIGNKHEAIGNKKGQPKGESNMDLWNNNQGREIAKEIIHEQGPLSWPYNDKIKNIIAEKIIERMKQGKLITNPNDKRIYIERHATGYAAPIENIDHIFTPQEIGAMSSNEFAQNESTIMQQLKDGLIQNKIQNHNYTGYINPITGNGQIFSREDIRTMSSEDYSKFEKAIDAQLNSIGIPTNSELQNASINGGGTVYVHPYTRADGTNVKGYYRSR